ncbi:substrate-binding domain-containing protein [Methylopila sp. 73B]|uniref:substrate-binding domain-containing protein n=1 Tax=Methylopila sp. 73B TaxID=1120792 RepID=UPI0006870D14|nr:substrate-binding domain-containing protein [Methylopila sp. 73B]
MQLRELTVALLISREGPAGIWGPSCEASASMAVAEINAGGGILGRRVELVIADAGSSDRTAAEAASAVVQIDEADAVVALVTSSARPWVSRSLGGRVPLVYTPQNEGGISDAGAVSIGETTPAILGPSLHWLIETKRVSRFFLLGNDYIWPDRSMAVAKQMIIDAGCAIVGQKVLPFGANYDDRLMAEIDRTHPDIVMSWLLGHETVVFNRAFAEFGLASRILRFSSAMDETILYGIGEDYTENLFTASSYFATLRTKNNSAFLERYHTCFGETPPPANSFGESVYEGFHCFAALAQAAGNIRMADMRKNVGRVALARTARGLQAEVAAGASHPVFMAAAEGHDFRLMAAF